MAVMKQRGTAFNVIYTYKDGTNKIKQHWETYDNELEAMKRKTHIDYLQKNCLYQKVREEALNYKDARAIETAMTSAEKETNSIFTVDKVNNKKKTYEELFEKWLPFHTKKKRLSPNTYDSYTRNLKNHILPYFKNKIVSAFSAEDIDAFIMHLSTKPAMRTNGIASPREVHYLSSSSIKKCYNILIASLRAAKSWKYTDELPDTSGPCETHKKRAYWSVEQVSAFVIDTEDSLLKLAINLAFIASMRASEVVGIDIKTINESERSFWITQIVQRVSDESLVAIPHDRIFRIFPKQIESSKSSLILAPPKTKSSNRKVVFSDFMLLDIKQRLLDIERNKEFYGEKYQNNNLLICYPDGRPIESKKLNKLFQKEQDRQGISEKIQFHGLRKSGQMLKIRLSDYDLQAVADATGMSVAVLTAHYNEVMVDEKIKLANSVGDIYYSQGARAYPSLQVNPVEGKENLPQKISLIETESLIQTLTDLPDHVKEHIRSIL